MWTAAGWVGIHDERRAGCAQAFAARLNVDAARDTGRITLSFVDAP